MKKYIWLGPSGSNPELGLVTNGEQKQIPPAQVDKFLSLKLIKEVTKEPATKKDKE